MTTKPSTEGFVVTINNENTFTVNNEHYLL